MRTSIFVTLAAVAALSACTSHETKVEPVATVPAPAPMTASAGNEAGQVFVTYHAPSTADDAAQPAGEWCGANYNTTNVTLIKDDKVAGRATFACVKG